LIGYVLLHYYFGKDHKKYSFSSFQHHERLDGSGYPLGIKTLNKYSQLIGVVDALDALISERPYRRKPFSLRAATDCCLTKRNEADQKKSGPHADYLFPPGKPGGQNCHCAKRTRSGATG
jgi:HD-GYP domain-containing protein (c-di-GMP phosphodiesterase class II)